MRTRSRRAVVQYSLDGEKLNAYSSIREAREACRKATHISSVCRGYRKTDAGYIWKYAEE